MNWIRLIADEQGNPSSARCGMWFTLVIGLLLTVLDAFGGVTMSNAAYVMLQSCFGFFALWAAGPRMAQYVGPMMSKFSESISRASASKREPDIRKDDESGEPYTVVPL